MRGRTRRSGHTRQCRCTGPGAHRLHPRRGSRSLRDPQCRPRPSSGQANGPTRRHRRRCVIPPVGRRILHHRHAAGCRRRMAGAMSERLTVGDLDRLGIDTVIIAGTDIQGRMFGKRMSPRVFATKVDEGLHICTCVFAWDMAQSLEGLHVDFAGPHTGWHDFALVPDLTTLRRAGWMDDTAICLADCVDEGDGSHLAIAPRTILRRQVTALGERKLTAYTATELEFFLYRGTPGELRAAGFRSMIPTTDAHADYNITEGNAMEPFFRGLRRALDARGVPADVPHGE